MGVTVRHNWASTRSQEGPAHCQLLRFGGRPWEAAHSFQTSNEFSWMSREINVLIV